MKKLYVMLPEKIGTIDKNIYGQFAEHIGGVMYDGLRVGEDSPYLGERTTPGEWATL